MMKLEEWRDVLGYEGFYQVSNLGRVKSIDRKVLHGNRYYKKQKGMILKGSIKNSGYHTVILSKGGILQNQLVHRLVAIAFIDNTEKKNYVNHKNLIKTDNNISNLEWVTAKENALHAIQNTPSGSQKNPRKAILQIDKSTGKLIKHWECVNHIPVTEFNRRHIYSCLKGKRKSHKGCVWQYSKKENHG